MRLTERCKANIHHKIHTGLQIYHYHNNHLTTPQELTNEQGEMVWLNYEFAWGGRYTHHYTTQSLNGYDILEHELQPIRFQGQYYDPETSLHYNRFRYYDSDVGMFIQRDPIGLLGGLNTFAYTLNPIMWIDPFGLYETIEEVKQAGLPKRDATIGDTHYKNIRGARRETMRRLNIPTSQSYTSRISKDPTDDRFRVQEIFNRDGKKNW